MSVLETSNSIKYGTIKLSRAGGSKTKRSGKLHQVSPTRATLPPQRLPLQSGYSAIKSGT